MMSYIRSREQLCPGEAAYWPQRNESSAIYVCQEAEAFAFSILPASMDR